MSTQSADIEQLCKAHKLINTTMQNCRKNKTVLNLVYCYVNMCLLKKHEFAGKGEVLFIKDKHCMDDDLIYVAYDDDEEHEATALDSFLTQSIMDSHRLVLV